MKVSGKIQISVGTTKQSRQGIIVLIVLLLAVVTSCRKEPSGSVPDPNQQLVSRFEPWPACAVENCSTTWTRLRILGMDAGSEKRQRCRCNTELGVRIMVQSKGQFAFLRQGTRIEQVVKEKVLMDLQGRIIRYHTAEGQVDKPLRIVQAGKLGQQLVAIRGPETIRSEWSPTGLAGPLFQHFLWKSSLPTQGQELTAKVFSHRTGKYCKYHVKVINLTGSGDLLVKVNTSDAPGVITTMELDNKMNIKRQRSRFGKFTIEAVKVNQKPKDPIPEDLPDIARFMSVNTVGTIRDPYSVCSARYRIDGLPTRIRPETFNGPGQKVIRSGPGTVEIIAWSQKFSSQHIDLSSIPEEIRPYLKPTALVASNDPRIRKVALEQSKRAKNPREKALALRDWVANNIRSDMGMTFASALEVLHTGRGDCSEKSVLLVALARSIGIPARAVIGLVFSGGQFAGHMWCEVWTGKWVPLDASLGPKTVSAARIRLGVDLLQMDERNVNNTALTEVLTAGVNLVVEKTSHWGRDGGCLALH